MSRKQPQKSKCNDTLDSLISEHSVIVCCGSGGVGKTTTSASIALAGAMAGRRTCVVTIDPARRLATALGIEHLTNTPVPIPAEMLDLPQGGELWAMMLDPKATFDDLIDRYAPNRQQAERILENRIYRELTSALSGTQEYMAMEKLYELVEEGGYDLVVVDTPPTRNAIDFLEAPARLVHFLEHRLFRMLLMPTRVYLRAVSIATQALLRTISKVAGTEIVEDAVAFFQAFEGMEEGFRTRAEKMSSLIKEPSTGFVLVTSPRQDAVAEADWFAGMLHEMGIEVKALVVNRTHPMFGRSGGLLHSLDATGLLDTRTLSAGENSDGSAQEHFESLLSLPPPVHTNNADAITDPDTIFELLLENLLRYQLISWTEHKTYSDLAAHLAQTHQADSDIATGAAPNGQGPFAVISVPLMPEDVHDLEGLKAMARALTSSSNT
ncbi:MAG: ArsA family ATPase [Acidimicrobiales bacterium]